MERKARETATVGRMPRRHREWLEARTTLGRQSRKTIGAATGQRFDPVGGARDRHLQQARRETPRNALQPCAAQRGEAREPIAAAPGQGFQTVVSPQMAAMAAFQLHTATGKLNAVITPVGPSGCHCSIKR